MPKGGVDGGLFPGSRGNSEAGGTASQSLSGRGASADRGRSRKNEKSMCMRL